MADPFLFVLGTAQDAGLPQAGCHRACCVAARRDPRRRRRPACVALVDPSTRRRWIVDATPEFPSQLETLDRRFPGTLEGFLITHGHVGHYTGLIHAGREAMGLRKMPVWSMPGMDRFLRKHAPWELLVRLENIEIRTLTAGRPVRLLPAVRVTPVPVPHRAEYTETVAFRFEGPRHRALWLPDIDRWELWGQTALEEALAGVDVAWLDGTFFSAADLSGREMSEVPHPTIVSTIERLAALPLRERHKVRFVHLNHSNAAANSRSSASAAIRKAGMRVAVEGERFAL